MNLSVLTFRAILDPRDRLACLNPVARIAPCHPAKAAVASCAILLAVPAFAQTPAEVFEEDVSPIVQTRCINCHVDGGASGNTRLVFVPSSNADYLALNLGQFERFLSNVPSGAQRILDKISARIMHGGGAQVPEDSEGYEKISAFLDLLGNEDATDEIIPDEALRAVVERGAR